MILFPAIDLMNGCVVRLKRGDYNQVTVYSKDPLKTAQFFRKDGAEYLHVVDLEGARDGASSNFDVVRNLIEKSGLKVEVGGGIRSKETIQKYVDAGAFRVILGTAAVTQPGFLSDMVLKYGDKIAVGVDIIDGKVAIKGWTEISYKSCFDFCGELEKLGVRTVICTDISKDGMLSGTNLGLYQELSKGYKIDFIASGGVSSLDDIRALRDMGLYGAILGKAIYTGDIALADAVKACSEV